MKRCCQYCGQPLPEYRHGVEFTRTEGRIYDLIVNAKHGISNDDLYEIVLKGRDRHTLTVHIYNINEKLAGSGFQIVGRDIRYLAHKERERPQDAISDAQRMAMGL